MKYFLLLVVVLGLGTLMYYSSKSAPMSDGTLTITSPAFSEGGMIPVEYTCRGANVNPELKIEGVPKEAKSLALIMDDPDAPTGTWVHWVKWNMVPTLSKIQKGVEPDGIDGVGSGGKETYQGPCPPSGTHRYFFKVYALDGILSIRPGSTKQDLLKAMDGHILAEGSLMGRFSKE